MCMFQQPTPEKAVVTPAPPPPPPPPPPSATAATMNMDRPNPLAISPKKKNPLRIDTTTDAPGSTGSLSSGLQVPV